MAKVKLVYDSGVKYRYDLVFRYTIKNFPKGMTFAQYEGRLKRKLKIKRFGMSWEERGRRSVTLTWLREREKKRICRLALKIDDGILREVQESCRVDRGC